MPNDCPVRKTSEQNSMTIPVVIILSQSVPGTRNITLAKSKTEKLSLAT